MAYRTTGRVGKPSVRPAPIPRQSKLPPTPRDVERAAVDRRRHLAWKAYDSLQAATDRLLKMAYEKGRNDQRDGRGFLAPTVEALRKSR